MQNNLVKIGIGAAGAAVGVVAGWFIGSKSKGPKKAKATKAKKKTEAKKETTEGNK